MKQTKSLMGMHVTVEVLGGDKKTIGEVFSYFRHADNKFSTYKKSSEVEKINNGQIKKGDYSAEMSEVLGLATRTKKQTNGYFDVYHSGKLDPSGIVKGWAIFEVAKLLTKQGYENFFVDAGGDIEARGENSEGKAWRVGVRNPFKRDEIIKVVEVSGRGVATSGCYERGDHIYNPKGKIDKSVSCITVIGPNVLEADRFATAAFAMGKEGIGFIESLPGLEGYMIERDQMATYTSGFEKYVVSDS